MLADTSVIHAFGDAQARHAEALDAARALLASARAGDALGSAGAAFTRALDEAVRAHAERIALLGRSTADAGALARTTAVAYATADARNDRSLNGIGD